MSTLLDEYELGGLLGKGAFSEVHVAKSKKTGQKFAVKIVDKSKLNPKDIKAIETEIGILSTTEHPNILKMYAHFFEKDKVYIVTELCEGGELFNRIVAREYYTETDAQNVLRAIASALQFCHNNKIVHRDLKPENILLLNSDSDSPIKLADFGFAKRSDDDLVTPLGTPNYIAPEILERKPYDSSVDLWSLGVIAYVLLSGYPPFFAETPPEIFNKIKSGRYRFDSPYWDSISFEAKDLISKLLILEPERRLKIGEVLNHPFLKNTLETKDITPALTELRGMLERRKKIKRSFGPAYALERMMSLVSRQNSS